MAPSVPQNPGRPARRRLGPGLVVLVSALSAVLALGTPSRALEPVAPPTSGPPTATLATGGDFASSFEENDPQPTWADTVETGPDGSPRAEGVRGPDSFDIPGDIREHIVEVDASGENSGAGEVAANLVDGNINSKWLVFDSSGWVRIRLDEPIRVVRYALTSANDAPERDPRIWEIQGSDDGQSWTTLDRRTGQSWQERFQTREFEMDAGRAYQYYRIQIESNQSGSIIQLAEWQLSDGSAPEPPPPNMTSHPDDGPATAYAAKTRVGFTGLHAFEYAGKVVQDSGGHSYNRVFDVNLPVTGTTELSYQIFPEFIEGDMSYASTYAAVDLAFTDGTYLSDLGAVDQHGFTLSPHGQGASKSLYTNQWNHKQSVIGEVAAGKTIDRIIVGYDAPTGPAQFRGWIDDISITAASDHPSVDGYSDYVLTTRGTHSSRRFSRGNTIPATAVPHGFNFWAPATNADSLSWFYQYHQDNNAQNLPELQALQLTHQTSPWMGDRQTFQVQPSAASGTPDVGREARALPFRHENETARPYYYAVESESGIKAEIAPTDHAAAFRFTFPGDDASLIFDNVNNSGGLTLDAKAGVLHGFTDTRSGLSNGATRMFVYATFDRPVTAGGRLSPPGREDVAGYLRFDAGTERQVTMRIATSLISVDQARKNLELEVGNASFDQVRARAKQLWDDKLDVIEVEGATPDQLTTLYSNLYRLFLYPNSGFENVGTSANPVYKHAVQSSTSSSIPAGTTETQTGAQVVDGKVYVNNGFWDTYRTTWAAYSLLTPSQAGEMVDGFVQQYRDGGWVARWSSPGYANLMTGTSSDVSFADAALKDVPGLDLEDTYDAALKNATVRPPGGSNPNIGRKGMVNAPFLGWVPDNVSEGVSWALEGYINDYGIANMAERLADRPELSPAERSRYQEEAAYFRDRARDYVHMFDERVGFFQGRNAEGGWKSDPVDYNPLVWGHEHDYTETDGWNFAFHVPHDGQGLANLYGGRDGLAQKLDTFFSTPETGEFPGSYGGIIHEMTEARDVRMGQWGFSNQVSHHIPWMYLYAGQPWKTQRIVREVLSRMYLGSEIGQGYAGDEDNGETSAWYVFASLGLYPLQMGSENYAIGSPLFTKATVHLESGEDLVVNAPDNSAENVYVQGLTVDGEPWNKTYLPHDVLADGATLGFDMGPEPSDWGTGSDAAPPSITDDDSVPRPMDDATGPVRGTATASGGTDVSALFDNTSATEAALLGNGSWVQYRFRDDTRRVVSFYTLTSADAAEVGDPTSWVLEGSNDGTSWTVLDRRSSEAFRWRVQTRPFRVDRPGAFSHYRISFGDGPAVRLSELELLTSQRPVTQPLTAAVEAGSGGPGDTVPLSVTVTNSGPRTSGQVALTVPDGWSVTPASADFQLSQGESTRLSFQVTVPDGASYGTYDIEAAVTSNHGSTAGPGTIEVLNDTNMWWSGNDQNWADVKLDRTVDVPAGSTDAKLWMWNDYVIEGDWDYGFVEVSTDGGSSWTELKVYDQAGNEVSTPDGYPDPNGRLADFGGKKYGLTGSTDGWARHYVDLTPYAGQTIGIRLRYATDAGFVERGWLADDFSLTSNGTTVWSDDVESGAAGWTATGGTWTDTTGAGWRTYGGP